MTRRKRTRMAMASVVALAGGFAALSAANSGTGPKVASASSPRFVGGFESRTSGGTEFVSDVTKFGGIAATVVGLSAFSAPATTVVATLYRASLDPESLAAVGLSANDAAGILNAAASTISSQGAALAEADESYGLARANVAQLEALIQSGQASNEQIQSLAGARTTAQNALEARDALLDAVRTVSIENLTAPQMAALASIRATNTSWSSVSAAYRISAHSDADFLALRDALAAKRIATQTGESVPEDAAALLATWSNDQAVAAAIAAQNANAAAIKATFDAAIEGDS